MDERERLIEDLFTAWNARDVDAIVRLATEDCVYINAPNAIEPGTRHGHEGLAHVVRAQWEFMPPGTRVEIEQIVLRENAVGVVQFTGAEVGGGAVVATRTVSVWTFRDGLVACVEQLGAWPDAAAEMAARLDELG